MGVRGGATVTAAALLA